MNSKGKKKSPVLWAIAIVIVIVFASLSYRLIFSCGPVSASLTDIFNIEFAGDCVDQSQQPIQISTSNSTQTTAETKVPTQMPNASRGENTAITFFHNDDSQRIRYLEFNAKGVLLSGLDATDSTSGEIRHWEAFDGFLDTDQDSMRISWHYHGRAENSCWQQIEATYRLSDRFVTQTDTKSLVDNCTINHSIETNRRIQ